MKELTEFLVRSLVDEPSEVRVEMKELQDRGAYIGENHPSRYASGNEIRPASTSKSVVIEISVAKEDMGKVIGKRGRTINAIRSLVKAAAIKENLHVEIELMEE